MSSGFGFAVEDGLQATTLAVFTVLSTLRQNWGGALILSVGLGPLGSAVALAANVAGAACLSIEPDAAVCRAAMRLGACDFLVNTVDESLRVLKNEIRQRRPLSVALELGTPAALGELLERGVLPEVCTSTSGVEDAAMVAAAQEYAAQGTTVVDLDGTLGEAEGSVDGQEVLDQCGRVLRSCRFSDAAALRSFDARLLATASTDPQMRWAAAAPRLFHRERPLRRVALLTKDEMLELPALAAE